jgi:hypothetical protein
MNDEAAAALDQTDEDILTCDVSDEALEAATGTPLTTVFLCLLICPHMLLTPHSC